MDNNLRYKVQDIAQDVRDWAEDKAEWDGHDLTGWCAKASAELFKRLSRAGVKAEIHMWVSPVCDSAHVFIVVEDHVVDVTATQFREFRNHPIVIKHVREAEVYDHWQSCDMFTSVKALRRQQMRDDWPADQVALGD